MGKRFLEAYVGTTEEIVGTHTAADAGFLPYAHCTTPLAGV
jgi:hypothetical protein